MRQHHLVPSFLPAVQPDRGAPVRVGDAVGVGQHAQSRLALGLHRDIPDRQVDQTVARLGRQLRPVDDRRLVRIEGVAEHAAGEAFVRVAANADWPCLLIPPKPGGAVGRGYQRLGGRRRVFQHVAGRRGQNVHERAAAFFNRGRHLGALNSNVRPVHEQGTRASGTMQPGREITSDLPGFNHDPRPYGHGRWRPGLRFQEPPGFSIFARLSIRSQIILALATMLSCAAALGLVAVIRVDGINQRAAKIGDRDLARTRLLRQMAYHTRRFRQLELTSVIAPDVSYRANELKLMDTVRRQTELDRAAYEQRAGEGEHWRKSQEMFRLWQAYLTLHERFQTLNYRTDQATAVKMFLGEIRIEYGRFTDVLNALIAANETASRQSVDEAAALGASARIWIISILAGAMLLCVAIAFGLISGICRPITTMTEAMRRLAQHDLAVTAPGVGRGDEIGAIAAAVSVFKDSIIKADRLGAAQEAACRP